MKRVSKIPTVNAGDRYDWDTLLDGSIWQLSKAEYRGDIKSFRSVAHYAAKKRGFAVTVIMSGKFAYLQALIPQ